MEEIRRNERLDNKEEEEDDVMLPGFRFHPTDEELVGFYLKRKIQHHPLSIELIKQLDIYKFDPWDLPKLATMGEKEWYFYCQRDRKYRNSTRPNRVTAAGFWKATGTDRPIYSSNSNGTKCIGLKKSLVFYKGRASKGVKTDWMMHEFRLPSLTQSTIASNKIPPNDSWAICKIFKKTNATTTQRAAISRSWPVSSLPLPLATISTSTSSNIGEKDAYNNNNHVTDITIPCNFGNSYGNPFDYFDFDGKLPQLSIPNEPFNPTFEYPPILEASDIAKSSLDVSSILLNMSSSVFGDFDSQAAAAVAAAAEADSFLLNEMKDQTNFNEEINVLLAQHQNVNMNVSDPCQWEGGVSFNSIWENSF